MDGCINDQRRTVVVPEELRTIPATREVKRPLAERWPLAAVVLLPEATVAAVPHQPTGSVKAMANSKAS
jgi:hypothetical protein